MTEGRASSDGTAEQCTRIFTECIGVLLWDEHILEWSKQAPDQGGCDEMRKAAARALLQSLWIFQDWSHHYPERELACVQQLLSDSCTSVRRTAAKRFYQICESGDAILFPFPDHALCSWVIQRILQGEGDQKCRSRLLRFLVSLPCTDDKLASLLERQVMRLYQSR